jgi:molybdopterin converting factor small subunit
MVTTTTPATLSVRVLLFGSYAENLGFDTLELALPAPATIGSAIERLRALPGGDQVPPRPLCALNLSQAPVDTALSPGDELAVLPPLSGG